MFGSDGAHSLNPGNAVAFVTSLLSAQLRPRLQSSLMTRRINLNDTLGNDPDGNPNHIEGHVAVSVSAAPEGALRFIALEWLRLEIIRLDQAFEKYLGGEPVGEEEEREIAGLLDVAREQFGAFSAERLLTALDGTTNPSTSLRAVLETRGAQGAGPVGGGDQDRHARSGRRGRGQVRGLRAQLAEADASDRPDPAGRHRLGNREVRRRPGGGAGRNPAPRRPAPEGDRRRGRHRRRKGGRAAVRRANKSLDRALTEVQNANGILYIFRKTEVVRDAAIEAMKPLSRAAEARLK